MKCVIIFLLVSNVLFSQSLKQLGDRLYYHDSTTFHPIYDFENNYSQGYNIIDSVHVFIAHSDPQFGDFFTTFKILDLENNYIINILGIGGTGDSHFLYNKENDFVLCNWLDGLYIFKLHDDKGNFINEVESNLILIKKNEFLGNAFWVNSNKIGYQNLNTHNPVTKYLTIDTDKIK